MIRISLVTFVTLGMLCARIPSASVGAKATLERLWRTEGDIRLIAVSRDGRLLVSYAVGKLTLWQVRTGKKEKTWTAPMGEPACMVFSNNGELLATGSHNGAVHIWDLNRGSTSSSQLAPHRILKLHDAEITALAFSPDGATLASSSFRKTGRRVKGTGLASLEEFDETVGEISLSRIEAGASYAFLTANPWMVKFLCFSPMGDVLASAGGNTLMLWSVPRGRLQRTLSGDYDRFLSVLFTSDGRYIYASSHNFSGCVLAASHIRVWNAETGARVANLRTHFGYLRAMGTGKKGEPIALSESQDGSGNMRIQRWSIGTWIIGRAVHTRDTDDHDDTFIYPSAGVIVRHTRPSITLFADGREALNQGKIEVLRWPVVEPGGNTFSPARSRFRLGRG